MLEKIFGALARADRAAVEGYGMMLGQWPINLPDRIVIDNTFEEQYYGHPAFYHCVIAPSDLILSAYGLGRISVATMGKIMQDYAIRNIQGAGLNSILKAALTPYAKDVIAHSALKRNKPWLYLSQHRCKQNGYAVRQVAAHKELYRVI